MKGRRIMYYYSHFFLTGELDEPPIIEFMPNGVALTTLWIKVDKPYFSKDSLVTETSRVPVKVFGKSADQWGRILQQGTCVSVEGEIRSFSWIGLNTDYEEKAFTIIELVAIRIRICEYVPEESER